MVAVREHVQLPQALSDSVLQWQHCLPQLGLSALYSLLLWCGFLLWDTCISRTYEWGMSSKSCFGEGTSLGGHGEPMLKGRGGLQPGYGDPITQPLEPTATLVLQKQLIHGELKPHQAIPSLLRLDCPGAPKLVGNTQEGKEGSRQRKGEHTVPIWPRGRAGSPRELWAVTAQGARLSNKSRQVSFSYPCSQPVGDTGRWQGAEPEGSCLPPLPLFPVEPTITHSHFPHLECLDWQGTHQMGLGRDQTHKQEGLAFHYTLLMWMWASPRVTPAMLVASATPAFLKGWICPWTWGWGPTLKEGLIVFECGFND